MAPTVIVTGSNSQGQGGLPLSDAKLVTPQPTFVDLAVRSVATGAFHTLVVLRDGTLVTAGRNDVGQCGKREDTPTVSRHRVAALDAVVAIAAAAGRDFSLVLLDTGRVVAFGANGRGQLGRGAGGPEHDWKPKSVLGLAGIVAIAAGDAHAVALDASCRVYTWGEGRNGQLGTGQFIMQHSPSPLNILDRKGVVTIACGASHSVFITGYGHVYATGRNGHGQLGVGDTTDRLRPTMVSMSRSKRFVEARCGDFHTVFRTLRGEVFVAGGGNSGQLGLGLEIDVLPTPRLISDLLDIGPALAIAAGRRHTMVALRDTELGRPAVFSFGANEEGQLGVLKHSYNIGRPTPESSPVGGAHKSRLYPARLFRSNLPAPHPAVGDASHLIPVCGGNVSFVVAGDDAHELPLPSLLGGGGRRQTLQALSSPGALTATLGMLGYDAAHAAIEAAFSDPDESAQRAAEVALGSAIGWLKSLDWGARSTCDLDDLMPLTAVLTSPLIARARDSAHLAESVVQVLLRVPPALLSDYVQTWSPAFSQRVLSVFQTHITHLVECSVLDKDQVKSFVLVLDRIHKLDIAPREVFYNDAVSRNVDLCNDLQVYKTSAHVFNFCRFSWILTPSSKATLLTIDRANALTKNIGQAMAAGDASPFFVLEIPRDRAWQVAAEKLAVASERELRKPCFLRFEGEEGYDEGGILKEFCWICFREWQKSDLFRAHGDFLWFSEVDEATPAQIKAARVCGILFGLAVYNGALVEDFFPSALYRYLVSKDDAVFDLEALREIDAGVASHLEQLLARPEEAASLGLSFELSVELQNGERRTRELCPGGANVDVVPSNVADYVRAYTREIFFGRGGMKDLVMAFRDGFAVSCDGLSLNLVDAVELRLICAGSSDWTFDNLRKVTTYVNGRAETDKAVEVFWTAVAGFDRSQQRKLLRFWTASDRTSILGLRSQALAIQKGGPADRLPAAHTCFNLLDLPDYTDVDDCRRKLELAIEEGGGFGLV